MGGFTGDYPPPPPPYNICNPSYEVFNPTKILLQLEWIDIANTEYRYTAIRIPVNTGIFNVFFLSQTELEKVFAASQNQRFLFYRNFPSKISPFIYFRLRRFNKQDVLVLLNQSC